MDGLPTLLSTLVCYYVQGNHSSPPRHHDKRPPFRPRFKERGGRETQRRRSALLALANQYITTNTSGNATRVWLRKTMPQNGSSGNLSYRWWKGGSLRGL